MRGKIVGEFVLLIERSSEEELRRRPGKIYAPITSMWRDCNLFNEVGIPSVTFGPGHAITDPKQIRGDAMKIADLYSASRIYTRLALHARQGH